MKKRIGSNQYQIQMGMSKMAWFFFCAKLVLWGLAAGVMLSLVVVIRFKIVKSTVLSPCANTGCSSKFVFIVRAADKKPVTPEEMVRASKHPDQIMHIWEKESTYGRNNKDKSALHVYCRSLGKSNEFGFGGMKNKWCYKNFQEAVNVVDAWLTERDNENLCYYNQGGNRNSNCEYVK